jgi:hypothetical protein
MTQKGRRGDYWSTRSAEERRNHRPSESLSSSPWRTMWRWIFGLFRKERGPGK